MVEGTILQKLDGLMVPIDVWVQGEPERTLLGSTRLPADRTHSLRSYRCSDCGFVELFSE
jgi:hypothetical protein